jgi:hypothetical protein
MADNDPVQKYFDALLATYDVMVDALEKANDRGIKVSKQLANDVVKGQRDAIELGRKFASQPTDMAAFYTAVLSSATEAQGRALAFTQTAYQEAIAAGTDARETIEKLVEANRDTARFAMEAARSYTAPTPWADAMARAAEAFNPAAKSGSKKAS